MSQFESGASRPGTETLRALAALLDVPEEFFALPLEDTHEGFFRSLRRTSVAERHRARAIGVIAHDIASLTRAAESVPAPTVPHLPVSSLDASPGEVEDLAVQVRRAWGIPAGPIGNVVGLLEAHGVLVIRLALDSPDVDAFSLPFNDQPVVVLGSDKNDRARSRFDAAHELGHLVMHGDEFWGLAEVERQAHQFAAAFLMPKDDIYEELPTTVDWSVLFQLKRKWQVSLAALLMRARTISRLNETAYLGAVKAASARGWRRVEPVPLGPPEQPKLLARLARSRVLASSAPLPAQVLQALISSSST
jgi:Zn-dependent peptidase ImmA (M78 family)